jgi:hypothetical protein
MQGIAIAVMVIIIAYLLMNIFNIRLSKREGIENMDNDETVPIEKAALESLNATIQSKITMLDDELMLKKYKTQYETTIINMDDYINLLMIQQIANTKYDSGVETTIKNLENLNILKSSKEALNTAMTYLDKL